jgi:hypothetical protein
MTSDPKDHARSASGETLWQPIETAPSEGREVLVWGGRHIEVETRAADGDYWRYQSKHGDTAVPTHWRPLPPPPETPAKSPGVAEVLPLTAEQVFTAFREHVAPTLAPWGDQEPETRARYEAAARALRDSLTCPTTKS